MKLHIWLTVLLALLVLVPVRAFGEEKAKKKVPTLTDQVMLNSIKSLLELGEEPSPQRVVEISKSKIENWNYYFERAALHGHLDGSGLVHQKTKALKMIEEIDRRGAEARRQNRPSAAKRVFRFITSPLKGPVKLAGKIREGIERVLPPFARPLFRVWAGQYTLKKYQTLLKALAAKHAAPQLLKALDIWKTVLIVQENPELVSKLLQGRLKELGGDELGKIIARVTERALGKLPGDQYGELMKQLLVFQAEELKKRLKKSWDESVDFEFDKNDKKLEKKIADLSERIVRVFPDKRLKKELDDASADFDKYIYNTVSGTGSGSGTRKKEYKITAVFTAQPSSGTEPLTVSFDASQSTGPIEKYVWDFGDGKDDKYGKKIQNTFGSRGDDEQTYEVILTVIAPDGSKSTAEKTITVKKDISLDIKLTEMKVEPESAKPGQLVNITGGFQLNGVNEGVSHYKFTLDGRTIKEEKSAESNLDYEVEYSTEYRIPEDIDGGKHQIGFEVSFEITETEHKSKIGTSLKVQGHTTLTIETETQPLAVGDCLVPKGAKFVKNKFGWYYTLDGTQVGPFKSYDEGDTLNVWKKGCYDENGNYHGLYQEWYDKGKLKITREFKHGLADGLTTEYYKNGKKEKERMYTAGQLNGPSTSYYQNGEKSAIVTYKDSVLHGETVYWNMDDNGRFKDEEKVYQNDTIVFERSYHRNGKVHYELTRKYVGPDRYSNVKYFDSNGIKTQDCNYLNGKEHGSCFKILEYNYQMMTENCTYDHGREINCERQPLPGYQRPD